MLYIFVYGDIYIWMQYLSMYIFYIVVLTSTCLYFYYETFIRTQGPMFFLLSLGLFNMMPLVLSISL